MQEGVEKGFPADDSVIGAEGEAEEVESGRNVEEASPQEDEAATEVVEELIEEGVAVAGEEVEEIQPTTEEVVEEEQTISEVVEDLQPEPEAVGEIVQAVVPSAGEEEPSVKATVVEVPLESETIPPATRPGLTEGEDGPTTMEALLQEEYDFHQPRRGDILSGVVISIGSEGVLVDVGVKQEGIVPAADLERLEDAALKDVKVGDEIPVYVLRPRDRNGNLLLSINRAQAEVDWTRAQKLMESGTLWEGKVTTHNQGGLVVPFGKIRGFLPASQVVGIPRRLTEEAKAARLEGFVNEMLPLKVIEVDRRRRRLIFSHRAAWWEWKEVRRERLLEELKEGDIREGVVSSLRDFGAFVDLGGADGLIHVSELTWHRVKHPGEVLKVGDKVKVQVLNVDGDRKRIGLSMKRLTAEPWSTVEEKYHVDQLVEGIVTRVVDFGAFVKLDEGVEGLIHRSELADVAPQRTGDLVKDGDLLLLRIIRIEVERRRIGLSLRRVTEEEWSEWAAKFRQEDQPDSGAGAAADESAAAEESAGKAADMEAERAVEADAVAEAEAETEADAGAAADEAAADMEAEQAVEADRRGSR